ncbi:hypothetical protein LP421_27705 [Rhizobium sp. RCAM05350]|nr:hypothetical protein LP421_27705 [Rhizobium sp. RCAM05350]
MDFLRNEGCLQVQGYLFGKPMPLSEIEHVVNATTGVLTGPGTRWRRMPARTVPLPHDPAVLSTYWLCFSLV